jgi:hypothetical protein
MPHHPLAESACHFVLHEVAAAPNHLGTVHDQRPEGWPGHPLTSQPLLPITSALIQSFRAEDKVHTITALD